VSKVERYTSDPWMETLKHVIASERMFIYPDLGALTSLFSASINHRRVVHLQDATVMRFYISHRLNSAS
jgi:hypothetical protein